MRNLIKISLLAILGIVGFIGCKEKDGSLQNKKEAIIGTWVGVEYPESDTAIFYSNNTAKFTGRAGDGSIINYKLDEIEIILTIGSYSSSHEYSFTNKYSNLYISKLMPSVGFDDNSILFKKLN